jgi:hypothetical protein
MRGVDALLSLGICERIRAGAALGGSMVWDGRSDCRTAVPRSGRGTATWGQSPADCARRRVGARGSGISRKRRPGMRKTHPATRSFSEPDRASAALDCLSVRQCTHASAFAQRDKSRSPLPCPGGRACPRADPSCQVKPRNDLHQSIPAGDDCGHRFVLDTGRTPASIGRGRRWMDGSRRGRPRSPGQRGTPMQGLLRNRRKPCCSGFPSMRLTGSRARRPVSRATGRSSSRRSRKGGSRGRRRPPAG